MNHKWKTQRKTSRKLSKSDSIGNLSGSFASTDDDSSLSFLDDMLGGDPSGQPQHQNVIPEPPVSANIDDILDLVSAGSGSRRASSSDISGLRSNSGNSSGYSGNKGREQKNSRADLLDADTPPVQLYSPRPPARPLPNLNRYTSGGSRGGGSREFQPSSSSRDDLLPSRSEGGFNSSTLEINNYTSRASFREAREEDEITPIPFFSVNTGNPDDDTISQITISVTSHYDLDSRCSGSYHQLTKSMRGTRRSQEDSSYADTLDEIADMLSPTNQVLKPLPANRSFHKRAGETTDDLFRSTPKVSTLLDSDEEPDEIPSTSEAPSLTAEEIYYSSKNAGNWSSKLSSKFSKLKALSLHFEPFLSQSRLQLRYYMNQYIPREWRGPHKKDEELSDYRGIKNDGMSLERKRLIGSILLVLGFFVVLTLVILFLRLILMHGSRLHARPVAGRMRGGGGHVDTISAATGGMSGRNKPTSREQVKTIAAHVAGGMAHHDIVGAKDSSPKSHMDHHDHVGVQLPAAFENMADVNELPVEKGKNIPFFWHIPRAAGGTVNDVFGGCLGLTLASDAGGSGEVAKEDKLQVVKLSKHFSYVNVNTATAAGLAKAKRLELAQSGLADVIVSTLLYPAADLFTPENRGRMFTVMRHPVDRAVSLFHYVQDTQWRRRQTFKKELSELTIDEYFKSGLAENNWVTRFLIDDLQKGELTKEDLNLAKEILRRKCLIGLMEEKGESFARFERYFGFPIKSDGQKDCHEKKLEWAWPLKHRHDDVAEDTPLWDLIVSHNTYDMELYRYAADVLFKEQGKMFQK